MTNEGELELTGFERIRTDSSNYTKEIQETVMRQILEGRQQEIMPYLMNKVKQIEQASLEDIAITKSLSKDLEEYTGTQQNYILAVKVAKMGLKIGDFVRMVPAKNYPHGMAVFRDVADLKKPVQVDWNKVIELQIKNKVEDLLAVIGRQWEEVTGQGRMDLVAVVRESPTGAPQPIIKRTEGIKVEQASLWPKQ